MALAQGPKHPYSTHNRKKNNLIPSLHFTLEQLRPFVTDEATYGRIYADLNDLLEASAWLLKTFANNEGRSLSTSELEELLIHVDIHFIDHVLFHLKTLRHDLKSTLKNFPNDVE
jgi:hypothetical protein